MLSSRAFDDRYTFFDVIEALGLTDSIVENRHRFPDEEDNEKDEYYEASVQYGGYKLFALVDRKDKKS